MFISIIIKFNSNNYKLETYPTYNPEKEDSKLWNRKMKAIIKKLKKSKIKEKVAGSQG